MPNEKGMPFEVKDQNGVKLILGHCQWLALHS